MNYFSENFKYLLKTSGYSHNEISELLQIEPAMVIDFITTHKEPDFNTLFKIISLFNISADELLYVDLYVKKTKNYVSANINCKLCEEKARTINALKSTIKSLKEHINEQNYEYIHMDVLL